MDNHDAWLAAAAVVKFAFFLSLFVLKREQSKESIGLHKQTY
jgi:hypothetical protein